MGGEGHGTTSPHRHYFPDREPVTPSLSREERGGGSGSIVIPAAARVHLALGGGTPVETGGRDDHVRRTRSLSRRALGGDRDPGRVHRLQPRGAYPREAGRQPSRAAVRC